MLLILLCHLKHRADNSSKRRGNKKVIAHSRWYYVPCAVIALPAPSLRFSRRHCAPRAVIARSVATRQSILQTGIAHPALTATAYGLAETIRRHCASHAVIAHLVLS